MTLFRLVKLAERDDVRVIEHLEDLSFFECFFFLAFTHSRDVHLLNDTEITVALAFDKVSLTKGALTEEFLFLVHFEERSRLLLATVPAFHIAHHLYACLANLSNYFNIFIL